MVLSLYTIRIVLLSLGQNDYGIYTLIAGVVSMLSFVINSLVSTTQRFISFYQGNGNISDVKAVFNNSLILHIIIGSILSIILVALSSCIFNGFLNIPYDRTSASQFVYISVIIMLI
jgi:Na+-driven multidrug efflux pump